MLPFLQNSLLQFENLQDFTISSAPPVSLSVSHIQVSSLGLHARLPLQCRDFPIHARDRRAGKSTFSSSFSTFVSTPIRRAALFLNMQRDSPPPPAPGEVEISRLGGQKRFSSKERGGGERLCFTALCHTYACQCTNATMHRVG